MPTDASNVCLSGKTGSDERALKTALLTQLGILRRDGVSDGGEQRLPVSSALTG
jgi:hypothetical protein